MDDSCRHPSDEGLRLTEKRFFARPHPHPDKDELPTLPVDRKTEQPAEGIKCCDVCDRLAIGTHYGAAVCGSCACMRTNEAFFRRTIGSGKSYQCTCRIPFRNRKKGCRHCRFTNCLKAGMDANVVHAIKSFPQSGETMLSQLLACRNRVYVSRGLLLRETDAERVENPRWRVPDLGRRRSFEYLCNVEYRGLTLYWTDFLRCFPHFKEGVSPTLLTTHFLAIWLKLEQILATVSQGSIDKDVCLSDYETTIPVTHDWFYAFYCRHSAKWTSDPAVLASLAVENTSEILHTSRLVRRASLDNLEVTAVIQFLVAYYGQYKGSRPTSQIHLEREMFADDASVKKFVNQVLRDLYDHYKSTYNNYHERLGVIVSIVGELHRVICLNKQFYMQLSLYTKSGYGMHLPSQKETVNTLHDLRRSVKM